MRAIDRTDLTIDGPSAVVRHLRGED